MAYTSAGGEVAEARGVVKMIPKSEWEWYGSPAHLIVADKCRFHMATKIGEFIVSTVGECVPPESMMKNDLLAKGIKPPIPFGDDGEALYLDTFGFREVGSGRKYETMVFRVSVVVDCECRMPDHNCSELYMDGYNSCGDAHKGHHRICEELAAGTLELYDGLGDSQS